VLKEYKLQESPGTKNLMLAGISAISEYSMLDDSLYTVYAADKAMAEALRLEDKVCVPAEKYPQ